MVLSRFLAITLQTSDASYQVLLSFPGYIALCQAVLVDVFLLVLGRAGSGFLVAFRSSH